MSYSVKEIQYTIQGEGARTGRPAVFLRFTGCNLWSGREADRATAVCPFCDTDFVGTDGPGGGRFDTASDLARTVAARWPAGKNARYVVCTGGEPLLQLDEPLIVALHKEGFEVAIETNGTKTPPADIDWICVSPKAGAELVLKEGDELKLVYPQEKAPPEDVYRPSVPALLPATYGRPRSGEIHEANHRVLPGAPDVAPFAPDTQTAGDSVGPVNRPWASAGSTGLSGIRIRRNAYGAQHGAQIGRGQARLA